MVSGLALSSYVTLRISFNFSEPQLSICVCKCGILMVTSNSIVFFFFLSVLSLSCVFTLVIGGYLYLLTIAFHSRALW